VKIKKLTKAVVLTLSNAEVADINTLLDHVDTRRLFGKREIALVIKLGGLAEAITGRRNMLSLPGDYRTRPEYEAAARATRGIWQTVRV
jgi:hypothetical protein